MNNDKQKKTTTKVNMTIKSYSFFHTGKKYSNLSNEELKVGKF